jgi:hypothetical protein
MYFSMCGPAYLLRAQCAKLESLVCALCSGAVTFVFIHTGLMQIQAAVVQWQAEYAAKRVARGYCNEDGREGCTVQGRGRQS